ncbi:MAG: hypothetical protein CMN55_03500 [Sneathiella sp.]|jgi:ubiquinone/menaquinone biosynthesis C-methylase UbiE|uniref:class I SAM-dependent methyltransferase n=1 Tax=Sneathiella sp. TaxID=1964365 RepID=UPI000C64EB8C|nr:class I SAM-dependent methyltransferase [Sneathiella sp.]MAL78168.1 hypothetical protein [Sneathiella sp.]
MSAGRKVADGDAKPPLKARLRAWWDGYELAVEPEGDTGEPAPSAAPPRDDGPPTVKGWSLSRQQSVVTLFGEGMVRCIPDDAKSRLTKPLGINKKLSVAELGAGLGGFARWVAHEYDAYVTGYEPDAVLMEAGAEMTKMAGQARHVSFLPCDFEKFTPKPRSADIVYASEALFHVRHKPETFRAIYDMLRPSGQFMMSDYMLEGKVKDATALKDWQQAEPLPPHLMEVQEARKLLTAIGFEVSIAENITAEYKANVMRAFADYATRTGNGEKSGHLHDWILKEGELWLNRTRMMDAGILQVFRIYARKPVEIT